MIFGRKKRKTIFTEYDVDSWLPVPESWPWEAFRNEQEWATTIGQVFADAYSWTEAEREWMTAVMLGLYERRDPEEHRFVYVADPLNSLFFLSLYQGPSDLDATLDDLSGASDPDVVRPPTVEPFMSPHLGEGVRTLRYKDTGAPDHDIAGVVHYAWRTDGMDIVVIAGDYNVVKLADQQGVTDEFARCISIVEV